MTDQEYSSEAENWKMRTLMVGGLIGLLAGVGAAYLLVQRAERQQSKVNMGTGEGIKLGLLVLGLLRQVALLGEGD
jgi:hypothetical protein